MAGQDASPAPRQSGASAVKPAAPHARLVEGYGRLPLSFEVNQGQTDPRVKFLSRGRGYTLFLTGGEAVVSLQKPGDRSQKSEGATPKLGIRESKVASQSPSPELRTPSPKTPVPAVLRLKLVGANANPQVSGLDELPGKSNYFIGNDPKNWRTNVPNYTRVRCQDVYPGIDLVYYGGQPERREGPGGPGGQLEYDFVVAPGADPAAISLAVETEHSKLEIGNSKLENRQSKIQNLKSKISLDVNGDLVVHLDGGEVRFRKPLVFQQRSTVNSRQSTVANAEPQRTTDNGQQTDGNRQFLDGRYVLLADNRIGFEVRNYDKSLPLVIDPVLSYSTYLGGSGDDRGLGIAMDASGNAYVTGSTASTDFPTAPLPDGTGPYQIANAGGGDAFVTKLNAAGDALVYSTYLGGSDLDEARGIAVDSSGNSYVTGRTNSSNFPVSGSAYQAQNIGGTSAPEVFVTELNPTGSALVYSTYFGYHGDYGDAIAVDSAGIIYVTGLTSGSLPVVNAYQPTFGGFGDAFVAKFDPTKSGSSSLVYSTYLGGSQNEEGFGIAVDGSGKVYVTGKTSSSTDFPTTSGAAQPTYGGGPTDAFVVKLDPTLTGPPALLYSTYLGGSGDDNFNASGRGASIALDSSGNIYVAGSTTSGDFPLSGSPLQSTCGGCATGLHDAFVAKINPALTGSASLVYSTYLGGSADDVAFGLAVDGSGIAYVTGQTSSPDFPATGSSSALFPWLSGTSDAFVAKINASGSNLIFASYLGGSADETGYGIAVNTSGDVFLTGQTGSYDFSRWIPYQGSYAGAEDVFVVELADLAMPVSTLSSSSLTFGNQIVGTTSAAQTVTLTNNGDAALNITNLNSYGDFTETTTCPIASPASSSCSYGFAYYGSTPFSSVYYITAPDASGDRLLVGAMTQQQYQILNYIPLPSTVNQEFCYLVELAPGYWTLAYVPTAAERSGDFSAFSGLLVDPTTGSPYPGGIIPANLIPSVFAWRIPPASSAPPAGLAPGASCNINVTFTPARIGARTGNIYFQYLNASNTSNSQSINLSGSGIAPEVTLSPSILSFGSQAVGSTSAAQTVTLTNASTATAPLTVSGVSTTGAFAQTNTCGGAIPIDGTCTITVTFTPTTTGTNVGAVVINDNDYLTGGGGVQTVTLVGSGGSAPIAGFCPATPIASNHPFEDGSALLAVAQPDNAAEGRIAQAYGNLPLSFEANRGQAAGEVKFISRGRGYSLFLTPTESVLSLRQPAPRDAQDTTSLIGLIPGLRVFTDLLESLGGPLTGEIGNWLSENGSSKFESGNSKLETRISSATLSFVRLKLAGANDHAQVKGLDELPGRNNYFLGKQSDLWQANVPTYARVEYKDVYPGVDLVYYGNHQQLEYDFVVAPGADPAAISLAVETGNSKLDGPQSKIPNQKSKISLDANGDLVIRLEGGDVRFHKPVIYQPRNSASSSGNSEFTIQNSEFRDGHYILLSENRIGFEVSDYDHARPLVIDPVLSYSTYLGGLLPDVGTRIAVDSACNAYVAGATTSSDFPVTSGVVQGAIANTGTCLFNHKTMPCPDAFVTKINAAGTALVYSTFLGGTKGDGALGLAVDASGNAYVTGATGSTDFPTTTGVLQPAQAGQGDAFVTKLNLTGSALVYSTYLGGSSWDVGTGIAVNSAGDAYVSGVTRSSNFPTTAGVFQTAPRGTCTSKGGSTAPCPTSFVAKLNPTGTGLLYSTLVGGSAGDGAAAIAIDASGNAYIAGGTDSIDYPTVSAAQPAAAGGSCGPGKNLHPCTDAFVTKLNPTASALVYSTYLGGTGDEAAFGIAVDSAGSAYVTGVTNSTNFPTTSGVLQPAFGGGLCGPPTSIPCPDAFVTKLSPTGSTLAYSTYLGGSSAEVGFGIAVDALGDAYVAGATTSTDFPVANAIQSSLVGTCSARYHSNSGPAYYNFPCPDAFVTKLNPTGTGLVYSTFLGGMTYDAALGVAVDNAGTAYVTGGTLSNNFPVSNALQPTLVGFSDAFVSKIALAVAGLSVPSLTFGNQLVGTTSAAQTVTLSNPAGTGLNISSITVSGNFAQTNNCGTSVAASASCTISVTFTPTATGSRTGTLTVADDAPNSPQTVSLTGTGVVSGVSLSATSLSFGNQLVGVTSAAQSVTVTNSGSTALTVSGVSVTGANPGDFAKTADTCTGASVVPSGTCSVSITFTPAAPGARTATLSIADDASGSPQTVSLTGTGVVPGVSLSTASVNFPGNPLNLTCPTKDITVTNTGTGQLNVSSIVVTGNFSETDTCSGGVAPGASCVISVQFHPAALGTVSGTLSLNDNAAGSPQTVALTGTGTPACAVLTSAQTATVLRGTASVDFTISDQKPSCTPDPIQLTCTVDNPATCRLAATTIQPTGSTTLTVGNLEAVGAVPLTVEVVKRSEFRVASVSMQVRVADFRLSAYPPAATVAAGQTASYSLTISPVNGLQGNVQWGCQGAPAGATCTVTPARVTLDGATPAQVSVSVATAARSHNAPRVPPAPPQMPRWVWLLGLATMASLALTNRRRRAALVLATLLLMALVWAACGGGGGRVSTNAPGTPAGSYGLRVTATYATATGAASNLNHTTDLTLTVN